MINNHNFEATTKPPVFGRRYNVVVASKLNLNPQKHANLWQLPCYLGRRGLKTAVKMQVSKLFLVVLLLSVFLWTVCAARGLQHENEEVQSRSGVSREGRQLHGQSGSIKDPVQLVTDPNTSRFMSVMLVGQVIFLSNYC